MSDKAIFKDPNAKREDRIKDLISQLTPEEKAGQLLHESPAITRLGIPAYNWWNECLHGIARAGKATIFPQAIGMAATFDPELIGQVGKAITDEARAKATEYAKKENGDLAHYRGLTFWTPNINIFRDPRWGRGQETYGEDPYLTSRFGVSLVNSIQETKEGVMKAAACAKHYAAHSGPEALRHEFNAIVSKKDLHETYLPAFKALVQEAKVESVMGAYNRTNGEPCCGSKTLLLDILRDDWGFKGHVVSDCWAIMDFHTNHKITKTVEESVQMALHNGLDVNCGCAFEAILSAIKKGLIVEADLDKALSHLLITRFKLGLLDPPETNPWKDIPLSVVDSAEHRALSRKVAASSMVLLKNENNLLPLRKDLKKLYLTGPNTTNIDALIGNYYGMNGTIVTPIEGITAAVDEHCTVDYRLGALLDREKPNPVDWASFEVKTNDVAIAFLGIDPTLEGEEGDALASYDKGDRLSLDIAQGQVDFLRKMKDHGTPVVVVLQGGSPIALGEVYDLADAILWAWYPGEEGGNAIADVLFGDVAPAGKLPITFPKSLDQLPPYDNYSMEGRTYRYMTKEPLFPFGFGLTYTPFEFSNLSLDKTSIAAGDKLTVSVDVTNKGTIKGDEVIQLYITDLDASVRVPLSSLRRFKRITLNAGEKQTFSFTLDKSDMEIIDNDGNSILESGKFRISVGNCSPGKRGSTLGAIKHQEIEFEVK